MMKNCIRSLILCCVFNSVYFQVIPENPCQNVFQYFKTNGRIHGRVEFVNDASGAYRLAVNMSVAAYLGNQKNIQLRLLTSTSDVANGGPLTYNIYFPVDYVIPKPTKITFNNKVYCSAPPHQLEPGGYVTNLWADTYLKIGHMHAVPTIDIFSNTVQPASRFPPVSNQEPFVTNSSLPTFITPNRPVDHNECGVSSLKVQSLVAGGDEVEEGQYPWIAAIMYKVENEFKYRCSGTVISNRHVITAAHCFQYEKTVLFAPEQLLVVLGIINLENWRSSGTIIGVESFKAHPDYKGDSADSDLTIITFNNPIEFNENVRRACLWEESDDLDAIVTLQGIVAGWGSENPNYEFANYARYINLPIVSRDVCLQSDPGYELITSARTFCAGGKSDDGLCIGDSGAGFLMLRRNKYTLRGVTSKPLQSTSICDVESFSVFADIAKSKNWIKKMLYV